MPNFSDIFVATVDTADQYDIQYPNFENISLIDVTDYEICTLWSCINREKFDSDKYELEFIELESDAILYQFPDDLVAKLAHLDEQQIITAAALWIEFEDINYKTEVAEQLVIDLVTIAKEAMVQQKTLFLIFC